MTLNNTPSSERVHIGIFGNQLHHSPVKYSVIL